MTSEPSMLDEIIGDLANDPDYIAEGLALGIVEDALAIMGAKGMNKARLADAMHVSRAYVTKVFNAPPNLTLRTIAQLAVAVGARPTLRLEPVGTPVVQTDYPFFSIGASPLGSTSLALASGASVLLPAILLEGSDLAPAVWPSLALSVAPTGLSFTTLTTGESCKFPTESKPTSPKSADSLPPASARLTPIISSTLSTTTVPSMAA